jgi:hypothetical protein
LVFLTGTAVRHWKGGGGNWIWDYLVIPIGPIWRRLDNVAPAVALAAIANDNEAVNAGWATDGVRWGNYSGQIYLWVDVALRDVDGWLYRVSYQATAIGYLY